MSWHFQRLTEDVFVCREYDDPSPHRAYLQRATYRSVCTVLDRGGYVEVVGMLTTDKANIRGFLRQCDEVTHKPVFWERASGKRVWRRAQDRQRL